MRRCLAAVIVFFVSLSSWAGTDLNLKPPEGTYFIVTGAPITTAAKTAAGACSLWGAANSVGAQWQAAYSAIGSCLIPAWGNSVKYLSYAGLCPAGTSDPNGGNDLVATCECPSPLVPGGADGKQCVPFQPVCNSGDRITAVVRVGSARYAANPSGYPFKTSDGRYFLAPVGGMNAVKKEAPPIACDHLCEVVSDGALGDSWYRDTPDAQGLHDLLREQVYMKTGASCSTPPDDALSANPTNPTKCDGFLGEVNGVTSCIAKVPPSGITGTSVPAAAAPRATASAAGGTGTPGTVAGTDGQPVRAGPNGEVPGKAGDAPGMVDLGGTGKEITPSPSTGTTVDSDGKTTTTTFDIEVCGVPGKPACKIDESGTPNSAPDGMKLDEAGLSAQAKAGRDTIGSTADKGIFSGWSGLFITPPPTACAPLKLPVMGAQDGVSVNPCPVVDGVRTFMAWLWALAAFWICLGWVRKAVA